MVVPVRGHDLLPMQKSAALELRFFLSSVANDVSVLLSILDEHHCVEFGAVLPGELVLWTKNAEQCEHGFFGGSVVPFRCFNEQVKECLKGAFE